MRCLILAVSVMATYPAFATDEPAPAEDHGWHLLTKSQGGTVSLISNLTKKECETMQAAVVVHMCDGCTSMVEPGDIEWRDAQCFR